MRSFFFLLLIVNCLGVRCQVNANDTIPYNKVFVKIKNGPLIPGRDLVFERHTWYDKIILDGQEFKGTKVTFYNTSSGLEGRFKRQFFLSCLYRSRGLNFFEGVYESNGQGKRSAIITYFYSKGVDKVKRMRTRNLVRDMSDDSVANQMIRRAGKASWISVGCLVGGYGSVLLSTTAFSDVNYVVLGAGVAAIINGVVFQFIRKRRTQHALLQYAPDLVKYDPRFFTRAQRRAYRRQHAVAVE